MPPGNDQEKFSRCSVGEELLAGLWRMSLNPEQQKAVEHQSGPLLILAGAGTGKTRVLTHRIAHMVEQCHISPGRILAVTFTNKASGEMRKRLENLIGERARDLWVGTFHSICGRILRKHALEAGLSPQFVIYDAGDQQMVLKGVLRELNIDEKRFPPNALVSRISRLKDQLTGPNKFAEEANDPYQKTLAKVYTAYQLFLEKNNAIDFGGLIYRCVKLFEKNEEILKSYQQMWQYILVDEYQDTNHAQYRWVTLIANAHRNLCVVGDPDQSIYRWRGADLNNILNFEKDYPDAVTIKLEQNYRSKENILKAASHVIAHNELRKEKILWSENGEGEKIHVSALNSEKEEAKYVVERLRMLHQTRAIPFSDMAIFYRTNAQSRPLEEVLRMAGIPYIIYGGTRFYERAEVKDALAYLRILNLQDDSISFKRIINVPARGIGKTTIDRIEQEANLQEISFYQATRAMSPAHAKLKAFTDWFELLRIKKEELSLVELLQQVLETSGLIRYWTMQGSVEAEERLQNLNELVSSIHDFEKFHPTGTLADYLEQIALISDLDQHAEGGVLPLMTLHLAKGLEFKAVAVVGLEEGLFPHSRSLDAFEELEEERRLFYVGMTRAKEHLTLTHAWRRYIHGQEQYGLPSRFFEEIPKEFIELREGRRDPMRAFQEEEDVQISYDEFDQRPAEEQKTAVSGLGRAFKIGSKVRHADFGEGQVMASEETSLGEKVTVRFSNGSLKKLIVEYAGLVRV